MGLFDTVRCDYPLPDPRLQDAEFQTKDLDPALEHYTITVDGRLVRQARRLSGRAAVDRDVEWPIHGDVLIYTNDPDRERGLVDLVVRFTHGRVESIRRLAEGESPRGAPPPQPWTIDWLLPSGPTARAATRDEPSAAEPAAEPSAAEHRPGTQADRQPLAPEVAEPTRPGAVQDATPEGRAAEERRLLAALRRDRAELEALLERCDGHWGGEDAVYRFYHQSFKVYALQHTTEAIVERLRALAPDRELNPWFLEIVGAGTGLVFAPRHNALWLEVTRPILEAYFHARYFLEMAVRYGDLDEPPTLLPSGWAALLYLFGLR